MSSNNKDEKKIIKKLEYQINRDKPVSRKIKKRDDIFASKIINYRINEIQKTKKTYEHRIENINRAFNIGDKKNLSLNSEDKKRLIKLKNKYTYKIAQIDSYVANCRKTIDDINKRLDENKLSSINNGHEKFGTRAAIRKEFDDVMKEVVNNNLSYFDNTIFEEHKILGKIKIKKINKSRDEIFRNDSLMSYLTPYVNSYVNDSFISQSTNNSSSLCTVNKPSYNKISVTGDKRNGRRSSMIAYHNGITMKA